MKSLYLLRHAKSSWSDPALSDDSDGFMAGSRSISHTTVGASRDAFGNVLLSSS